MPNGELRFCKNNVRNSTRPSPSASRSKVMRFADGTPAPARPITHFMTMPLIPLPSSGLAGALLSATRTSPLGSTWIQRGCSKPTAKGVTAKPGMGVGITPWGQPTAGAMLTVGIRLLRGLGKVGLAPMPALGDNVALSPHATKVPSNTRQGNAVPAHLLASLVHDNIKRPP